MKDGIKLLFVSSISIRSHSLRLRNLVFVLESFDWFFFFCVVDWRTWDFESVR